VERCDALDGVVDGIVADPRLCDFSPLRDLPPCKNDVDKAGCFTQAQIAALEKVHKGPSSNGQKLGAEFFFSGVESYRGPSPEKSMLGQPHLLEFSWNVSGFPGDPRLYPDLYGPGLPSAHYSTGSNWLRFIVFGDSQYLLENFDFNSTSDVSTYFNATAPQLPSSPDLSAFRARGGKLIEYHGWGESNVNPAATVEFYEASAAVMGSIDRLKTFDRLFMVPGMTHCGGGPGAWAFDPLPILERWVEQGQAPDSIVGSNPDTGVTRPICAYPNVARLIRPGLDPSLASNFRCIAP